MSQGRRTRFTPKPARLQPVPKREQFLDHDWFYPCQRCGDPWPRRKLRREPVTRLLVCVNDYDEPSVSDIQSRRLHEIQFRRHDRLQKRLSELP